MEWAGAWGRWATHLPLSLGSISSYQVLLLVFSEKLESSAGF